ncbi:hypothetical protein BKA61DRAFT_486494 [Leptodontidium sp. MPI-SDFR-AT-0119]|nr:hypothetical protein BKA61DRAFT_486494 [Leptodontidium sp. MPI-SDFR-AT-0119]
MNSALKTEREGVIGAFPPPFGVVPNFNHPKSQGNRIVIAIAILLPLATFVFSLRIYTKRMIIRTLGSDDCKFVYSKDAEGFGLVFSWLTIYFKVLNLGLGVHIWDVPLTTFSPHYLKMGIISGLFYGLSFMCTKLSILLLYLRLSPFWLFRITVWIVVVVTILYSVLGSFEFLFNCRPIAKNWDVTISGGSCIEAFKVFTIHGVINILTDFVMLALPVLLVYKLQLPIKQKVAVAGLFMTGTLVCIVSSIKLKVTLDLLHSHSMDSTWMGVDCWLWTTIEVYVGIICSCLITFKPFLRHHFPGLLGTSSWSVAHTSQFSKRAANTLLNTSTAGHELESCKGLQKSRIPRKSKQQTDTDTESQEDILRDEYMKDISSGNQVATSSHVGERRGCSCS